MKPSIIPVLALAALSSCTIKDTFQSKTNADITAKGPIVTRNLQLDQFSTIEVSSAVEIKYTQHPGNVSATLSCPEDIIPYYIFTVSGNKLIAKAKDNTNICLKDMKIVLTVSSSDLTSINMSGSSAFKTESLSTRNFTLIASGASEFNAGSLSATDMTLTASGSSELDIKALQSTTFELTASGASEFEANKIDTKEFDINLSGSSELEVNNLSTSKSNVMLSGASDAKIVGKSTYGRLFASGSSEINAGKLLLDDAEINASGASSIKYNALRVGSLSSTGSSSTKNLR